MYVFLWYPTMLCGVTQQFVLCLFHLYKPAVSFHLLRLHRGFVGKYPFRQGCIDRIVLLSGNEEYSVLSKTSKLPVVVISFVKGEVRAARQVNVLQELLVVIGSGIKTD